MSYTVRHAIDTTVDGFWKLFLDMDVARAMWVDLGSPGSFEIVDERVTEQGSVHWKIEYAADVPLPDFVKKLVGDGSYTEIGVFDNVQKAYRASCIPKVNAEKFATTFEITVSPIDDGKRCERTITVENKVKVFGVGKLIEVFLERTQKEAHLRAADFLNRHIRANGLGAT